jgi:hypothetical protein
MDGLAGSEHGIIRLLAFNYGYFRLHFYFRFHILSSAKNLNPQVIACFILLTESS